MHRKALEQLKTLFVGVTGIFDHNPKSAGQTARIFSTSLETDSARKTRDGEPYTCLKACAYMVRTSGNEDLIREIDAGIKKEVSISCSAKTQRCSICGTNRSTQSCSHTKGRSYQGKFCSHILEDISDAYEWSFVAVPAQRRAGVTKQFGAAGSDETLQKLYAELDAKGDLIAAMTENLRRDVIRLSHLHQDMPFSAAVQSAIGSMEPQELLALKEKLMKEQRGSAASQLQTEHQTKQTPFQMEGGGQPWM